jgi:AraC-like DNA-binding protein
MRRARRLLAETDLPVREIATRLGYEDPLYFSRVFRKVVGLPATAYRERHRNELTFGQLQ